MAFFMAESPFIVPASIFRACSNVMGMKVGWELQPLNLPLNPSTDN